MDEVLDRFVPIGKRLLDCTEEGYACRAIGLAHFGWSAQEEATIQRKCQP